MLTYMNIILYNTFACSIRLKALFLHSFLSTTFFLQMTFHYLKNKFGVDFSNTCTKNIFTISRLLMIQQNKQLDFYGFTPFHLLTEHNFEWNLLFFRFGSGFHGISWAQQQFFIYNIYVGLFRVKNLINLSLWLQDSMTIIFAPVWVFQPSTLIKDIFKYMIMLILAVVSFIQNSFARTIIFYANHAFPIWIGKFIKVIGDV
jgi:hypothetical protein